MAHHIMPFIDDVHICFMDHANRHGFTWKLATDASGQEILKTEDGRWEIWRDEDAWCLQELDLQNNDGMRSQSTGNKWYGPVFCGVPSDLWLRFLRGADVKKCDGCDAPAKTEDDEGVPLCWQCLEELTAEADAQACAATGLDAVAPISPTNSREKMMLNRLKEWAGMVCSGLFFSLCALAIWKGHYDALATLLKLFFGLLVGCAVIDLMSDAFKRFLKRRLRTSPNRMED